MQLDLKSQHRHQVGKKIHQRNICMTTHLKNQMTSSFPIRLPFGQKQTKQAQQRGRQNKHIHVSWKGDVFYWYGEIVVKAVE